MTEPTIIGASELKENDHRATTKTAHHMEAPLTDSWYFHDTKICYHMSGSGETMIFLHNGGADHRIWDYQIEHYTQFYKVYALDLPGFGESDQVDEIYTLNFYTELLAQFINDKHLDKVTLVGNCIGSAMSLNYAIQNPSIVKRMILFNIVSEKTFQKGTFGRLQTISKIPVAKGFFNLFVSFIRMPNFYIKRQLKKLYGDKGLMSEPDPKFLVHLRNLFKKTDQLPALTNILVHIKSFGILDNPDENVKIPPTYVFWGEQNKILPVSAGQALCNAYNLKKFIIVQDTGHLLMREKYKKINATIDNLLKPSLQ